MDPLYHLELSKSWVTVADLEKSLCRAGEPHARHITDVVLTLPIGCKVMVDAGTLLLSLLNQLADSGRRVVILFEEGEDGVMGYLNRIGFFDWLHP
jgi:hypothetical protein